MNGLKTIYLMLSVVLVFICSVERISCLEKTIQEDAVIDPQLENVVVRRIIDKTGQKIYNLNAFGEDLKLIVSKNDELASQHADVIKRHNGRSVSRERIADLGYHTGYVESKPGSSLAVKIKDDCLSGVITTRDHFITIDGLGDLCNLQHVITRRKHEKDTSKIFGAPYLPTSHIRNKRSAVGNNRHIEVLIVADNYTTSNYGSFTEQYIMSVAFLTNALLQDNSIGDIKVVYVVVKLMIISGYEEGLDVFKHNTIGSVAYLSLFAGWVKQYYKSDDSDPEHFDQGLLLSKRLCGMEESCGASGRAYLGRMCSSTLSMASVKATGLTAGLAVAHETGHNFGLRHDSGDCRQSYIMNSVMSSGGNAFKWSPCSRVKFQAWFKDSNNFKCLNDIPASSLIFPSKDILNLATNYSGDDQCRIIYGPDYGHCGPLKSNCGTLYCRPKAKNVCYHRSSPPLEGTTCATYKWCKGGYCVDQPIPPAIDGNWGSWSTTFSYCTRSCGMGVRYRTRNCDNPKPEYFGKACLGESKGHFETCNTQDCPSGTPTFRHEQCQEKSPSFSDHFSDSAPCLLRCRLGNTISLYGTVKDGSLCSKYQDIYDVCVLGKCMEVGCDRGLLSQKYYDRCRVCEGDGSTCTLIKETYSTVHRGYGAAKAATMLTLPIGATHFFLKEPDANYNEIGVKDQNDNWIIGPEKFSTIKYFAGTRITYDRESSKYAESLTIIGPITEPLKIMFIYFFERNPGTDYQYYKPLTTPDTSPVTFIWKYIMSECDQTCAGGMKHKIPKCHRTDDDTEVGINHCDAPTRPSGSTPCNTQACEPRWEISTWSRCNAVCGPSGERTRSVECRQKISSTEDNLVDDNQCQGTKEKTEEECNRWDCEPDWEGGDWSACSRKTCNGTQTRAVSCKKLLVTGEKQDLLDSQCTTEKPITEVICNSDVRCHEWRPVYPSCTECEVPSLITDTTYKDIGCYNLKNNLYGPMLEDLRGNSDATDIVDDCAISSWKRGRQVFAVGNDGICYSSMDAHTTYYKDGKSSNCVNKIGGQGAVFVYALNGLALVSKQTCFYIEDDSEVDNSFCHGDGNPLPNPEIKICCEDICESRCFKTVDGRYCVIPYIYKGQLYYGCTRNINENNKLWCATTSNYDIDAEGDECEEPCRQKTTSGHCCSFPFIYRGRLHNTCITSESESEWCALTSNYDRDYMKDTCT